jgi:hypothetical protein
MHGKYQDYWAYCSNPLTIVQSSDEVSLCQKLRQMDRNVFKLATLSSKCVVLYSNVKDIASGQISSNEF